MNKCFKIIVILFAFLFVSACSNNESSYKTKMVSSSGNGFYHINVASNEENEVLKANITIFNENYSSFLGLKYRENSSYGSGVIYKSDDKFYYALTNNHVISRDYLYNNQDIYIEDYYCNKYAAEVVYSDITYDLAVIRFSKNNKLSELKISEDNVSVRESVRSIGNPNSIKNVVSEGMINCYSYINLDNKKSKVDFEVIVHSALISGGSSGGALIDSENQVVGITFAGVFDNNGSFITGYAIPSSKIIEFLNK